MTQPNSKLLYCAICWQEFDYPEQHDAASAYKGERLNGHCPGDIKRQDRQHNPRVRPDTPPYLPEAGEPLTIR